MVTVTSVSVKRFGYCILLSALSSSQQHADKQLRRDFDSRHGGRRAAAGQIQVWQPTPWRALNACPRANVPSQVCRVLHQACLRIKICVAYFFLPFLPAPFLGGPLPSLRRSIISACHSS